MMPSKAERNQMRRQGGRENSAMLIELLLVGVILGYLYGVGFLEIGNPWSIAISVAIVMGVMLIGWMVTRLIAVSVVDGFLGFRDGASLAKSPSGARRTARRGSASLHEDKLSMLERFVKRVPRDPQASLELSEEYLRRGMTDKFLAERERILNAGVLAREQAVMALNRMADVEWQRGNSAAALGYIEQIMVRYPGSEEAARARIRYQRWNEEAISADSDAATT
jgi:hypothetical protein